MLLLQQSTEKLCCCREWDCVNIKGKHQGIVPLVIQDYFAMESPGLTATVEKPASPKAGVTNDQWRAMTATLEKIYASKDEE